DRSCSRLDAKQLLNLAAGDLCNLPIMPFGEIMIDDPLHFVARTMAICVVGHECSGNSAEGASFLPLLSYLRPNASMAIAHDLIGPIARLLETDARQSPLIILADADTSVFAVHADADEERFCLFPHPNAEALNLAPLPYVHLPLRWVLQPLNHLVGKHAHPL